MEALQRAIADACLSADAGDELARDLRGFLLRRGVAPDDVEAIVAAPARLGVYRSLVRNGFSSIVARVLPRTRARMNAACSGRFDADFAAFVDEVGPRTHYLRDVPAELLDWALPRWRRDPSIPPYLSDLAAYELTHFAVAASDAASVATEPQALESAFEIALDRPLRFAGSARMVRYEWAVHELSFDADATDEPAQRKVGLFVYRDRAHEVRWLAVTPLAGSILERLLAGQALGAAVHAACAAHATAPADVLSDIARLLGDLGDRGALVSGAG